jgi:hypothetical protein
MSRDGWEAWKARSITDPFAAAVVAAHAAMKGRGPDDPEWKAWLEIEGRWRKRPRGRRADPGDLDSYQMPGEMPHGGDVRCRRCHLPSSLEGHPHGCPRTPDLCSMEALRACYCGAAPHG